MHPSKVKGIRIIAAFFDLFIFAIFSSFVSFLGLAGKQTPMMSSSAPFFQSLDFTETLLSVLSALGVGLAYYVLIPTLFNGQTFGKMLFRIKVVTISGESATWKHHALRAIFLWGTYLNIFIVFSLLLSSFVYYGLYFVVGFIQFGVILASLVSILSNKDATGLHDQLAKTLVVSVEDRGLTSQVPPHKDNDWLQDKEPTDDDDPFKSFD